jgi:hypothetical protein
MMQQFSDPQTIKVADLRIGDFVVEYPAQANVSAREIKSIVATLAARWDRWAHQSAPRRPKLPVPSKFATFVSSGIAPLDLPDDCDVIVRRPVEISISVSVSHA